jgi:membrane protein implicated in regulation of membrane protease activity
MLMEQFAWIGWTIFGVVLIVAEIFTLGFVLFWFGIGALAAALAGFLGVGFIGQFLIFAVVSISLTFLSRQIFSGYQNQKNDILTGIDSIIGQVGTVSSPTKGELNKSEVKVFGSIWSAISEDGEKFLEGEKVEVVGIKGSTIYVQKYRELPEWREE